MMTSRQEADAYCRAVREITNEAVRQFQHAFDLMDGLPPEQVRDTLLVLVPAQCEAFGNAAAACAADYVERMLSSKRTGGFTAVLATAPLLEPITESVRFAAGFLFIGQEQSTRDILSARVLDLVHQMASRTMLANAVMLARGGW